MTVNLHQNANKKSLPTAYKLTKKAKFGHYAEEKATYISDFLEAIGIKRIDMLIGHSSAIYPLMLLLQSDFSAFVKSVVLLNPCGHRRIKAMKYPFVDKLSAYFYQYAFFRIFIKTFGKPVLIATRKFHHFLRGGLSKDYAIKAVLKLHR